MKNGSVTAGGGEAERLTDRDELASELVVLARALQGEPTQGATLEAITRAAIGTVPGAEYAGIMQVEGRRQVRTYAATDPLVERVDRLQYETGEGPCLNALYEEYTVWAPDLGSESRWPRFGRRVSTMGVGSMLSFRLFVQGERLGTLNLYAARPNALDEGAEHVGRLFAAHAAVAMASARQHEQLTEAVRTRDLIGQAKGILMERYKITDDQAFDLLVQASQRTNLKLRDLAERLAQNGELHPGGRQGRS